MQNTIQHMDLIYGDQFDIRKGNIIEVTDDFLDFIDQNQRLLITGDIQDDMILSTDQKTYKMRGINLPTTLLAITQNGAIQLQLNHFLKLEDYNHQYHRIYKKIKMQSPSDQQFETFSIEELVEKYGINEEIIRQKFKISLKEFNRFQQFVDFLYFDRKRLFIPLSLLLKYMRNMMMFLSENNLMDQWFILENIKTFNPQISCFPTFDQQLFRLVAKKFKIEIKINSQSQKIQIEGEINEKQDRRQQFRMTYESVLHFILLQLAIAKPQYVSKQMDQLIKDMLNIYIPLGMELPSQQERQSILKRVISSHFIQNIKNNTSIRVYYDPLEVESTLKGRIKFMATFKQKFTKDQIRGVFEGMILQDASKEIKQLSSQGRKTIDMDDLLLKNFRKFNELYEIKLILPK